jgi:outer membrane receptor for ferrienterochelin and colicin
MIRSGRFVSVLAVALLVFMPALSTAQSQATTGVIEGTVSDPSGAPIAGATVLVKNTATNLERTLATDADGRFRALLLPLGPYRVTVSLTGFSTLVREGIQLTVGQAANLALQLKVSTLQEEVVVQADSPVIETTRAESSTRINSAAIRGLPNNGRNFLDFTKLTPGVSIVQGPDGDELTINGQKGIYNNVSVDGADFNNPFFGEQRGGQRPAFTFNLDAVQEVVVVASGANAEFGRSNGGFVNVVTKSGTNAVHGTLHAYFKDDSLSSAPKKADGSEADKFPFSQQQFGFTLGGPIVKDKAFYFVALDYQNGESTKQTDPARIEQRVVDYFAALGSPGENGSIERTNDARVFLGKVDWQLSPKHLATIRYNYTWAEQKNGTFDVDSWGVSANATEKDDSHAVTGSLISNLSASLLNEFRFQWARENRPRPYDGPNITGQSRPLPDTAFDFGRAYRFGEPFFIPVDYFDERIQFNNNISVIKGRHSMKFGVEFNRVHSNQTFRGFQNGRYIFGSTDGFLNYARNPQYVECSNGTTSETGACPAGSDITGPLLLFLQQFGVGGLSAEEAGTQDIPQTELAFFAQDKWQPSRTLTVSYGLRWEMQKQADMITPANEVFYAPFIGQTVNGRRFPSDGTIPSDYGMWQPRLGLSWDPKADGKTVVRLNGGLFYGRVPGLALASSRSTNGSRAQNAFRASFFNGFGVTPPTYPNLLPAEAGQGVPDHPGVFVFDENFQNPRTWSASASVEREVVENLAVLVQYNYAKGEHLTRFLEQNDTAFGCPWGTGLQPGGTNGIACGTSGGAGLTSVESTAKSSYNGLTLGLTKRFANNYQFQANYTMSWDKSDDDNERDPFTYRYIRFDNLDAEYGYSDRDQRHRLNAVLLWIAPARVNVNLRYSYRSAQPLSLSATGAVSQTVFGPTSDRIRSDGSIVERNSGRKDNEYSSLDLRLSREFALGKRVSIEPIFEVFNLFNSKNLLVPQTTNLVFNFDGTIASGLGAPRQAQLGARLIW